MAANYEKYNSALPTNNDLRREVVRMIRYMMTLESTTASAEVDGASMATLE